MDTLRLLFFGIAFAVLVFAADSFGTRSTYYSHTVIEVPGDLQIEFLQEPRATAEACRTTGANISNAIRATCPTCAILLQRCISNIEPELSRLTGEQPVAFPSARVPGGSVGYHSVHADVAMAACRETERRGLGGDQAQRITCFPAGSIRPLQESVQRETMSITQFVSAGLAMFFGLIASAFSGFLILRYEGLHARWTHDGINVGPQKFHAAPTPRIGGLSLIAGLCVSNAAYLFNQDEGTRTQFGYLLLAALPAFAGGLTEDITKNVSVIVRLAMTIFSAAFGVVFFEAVLMHVDAIGIDSLLQWHLVAVAFTIVAVGGVTNALNIIDGYHGLAAGYALITFVALGVVAAIVGDAFLFAAIVSMAGALMGFLIWNYPNGRVFLGDSGAYLLGFWLAELSVLLVVRHPNISPWFPMVLMIYPVFETLFTIYRRKVLRGDSPGRPDRLHLHQVIYMRLIRTFVGTSDPSQLTRRNSLVAPYIWVAAAALAVGAVVWRENTKLLAALATVFCIFYVQLYGKLVTWRAPSWLIRGQHRG